MVTGVGFVFLANVCAFVHWFSVTTFREAITTDAIFLQKLNTLRQNFGCFVYSFVSHTHACLHTHTHIHVTRYSYFPNQCSQMAGKPLTLCRGGLKPQCRFPWLLFTISAFLAARECFVWLSGWLYFKLSPSPYPSEANTSFSVSSSASSPAAFPDGVARGGFQPAVFCAAVNLL